MDPEIDRRKSGVYRHRKTKGMPEPIAVGEAIRQAIDRLGLTHQMHEHRALALWPEIVGKQIAAVTRAHTVRRGELLVSVTHDAWRHRLLFERDQIRHRLNRAVGREVVRIIRLTK